MVNKKVQNEVTQKEVKKKGRRLKRSVRKTFGALFLASAIGVAAIPTDGLQAAVINSPDIVDKCLTWKEEIGEASQIPLVTVDDPIYATEDNLFQFAWVPNTQNNTEYIAVIVGYNAGSLEGGNLTIPDKVDAYTRLNVNDGSTGRQGMIAVSRSGKPLYYQVVTNEGTVSGSDGVVGVEYDYLPCYASRPEAWRDLELDEFWYKDETDPTGNTYKQVGEDEEDQWLRNVPVLYIGNQYLTTKDGKWVIAHDGTDTAPTYNYNTNPANGIFAEESNITNLTVGDNLLGIGNYAFYNCATLESIKLGNGILEIGHNAFENCVNMTSIQLEFNSKLTYISDYTFAGCRALRSFRLPAGVTRIFDHAFDGCTALSNVDLNGNEQDKNTTLNEIGYYVFSGCTALNELILPINLTNLGAHKGGPMPGGQKGALHLNNFERCTNLRHIQVLNPNLDLVADATDSADFSVNNFKSQVDPTFYFEAADDSGTHDYTQENAIAFKYEGKDLYEIIILENIKEIEGLEPPDNGKSKLTYQVNSSNSLVKFDMEYPVPEVTIPSNIGPYGVSSIQANAFSLGNGMCFLEKITIPATVIEIGDNAFRGCHALKHVIFQDASKIKEIGDGAFETQNTENRPHLRGCDTDTQPEKNPNPILTFTGEVGAGIVPFDYAMDPASNINVGQQQRSYIKYYSGWPTNLTIQYVVSDQMTGAGAATLVNYPVLNELKALDNNEYPYLTTEYINAAKEAFNNYSSPSGQNSMDQNQWDIINAAINVYVPSGVKQIATGLFSGKTGTKQKQTDGSYKIIGIESVDGQSADENIQTVTFADIDEFEPYSFTGCTALTTINITGGKAILDDYAFAYEYTNSVSGGDGSGSRSALTTVNMTGGGSAIGDYAFCNNNNLTGVRLSNAVSQLGLRPFKDCGNLITVDFSGGQYFTTEKSIIYGLTGEKKTSLIECLESRGTLASGSGTTINPEELADVISMSPEAFMDVSRVGVIDFRSSSLQSVPKNAFANTPNLHSVYLPSGCKNILDNAFHNSNIQYVEIPQSVAVISNTAFDTRENPPDEESGIEVHMIEFYCEPGSNAAYYADSFDNIIITDKPDSTTFKVQFWYYTDPDDSSTAKLLKEEEVPIGEDANPPDAPAIPGYRFVEWRPDYHDIGMDATILAYYAPLSDVYHTVTFYDDDQETVLSSQQVRDGEDAIIPRSPTKEGYIFNGWIGHLTKITRDEDVYASYRVAQPGEIDDGTGGNGSGSGGNGSGGNGSGGNGSGSDSGTFYTLTVVNGSGSGSYKEGSQPFIIANNPASGQVFDHWSVSPDDVKIASTVLSASIVTMPAKDVTVTAHYKAGSSSTTGGGTTGSGNNSQRPSSGSGTVTNGGTTVVIDKNGLSNTGVVSATVNGSSDNFTIKITESNAATEAALRALMAEYGSLDNIKYFPMDISLYDSTGTYKITDTTGISVTITLPLPDSLIPYAGNNRAASVVNDRLERLSARFTTIQGVSCITFTAEHFSPYVIYVNTGNLSSGEVSDDTPKTGDFIHPKWFLSIALACMSFVLFMQKDARRPKKVKVKVKAR